MVNITLSVSEDVHKKMKQFSDIKWTEIARKAIEQRIEDLELMNKIASKSKITSIDVEELAKRIKRSATNKFLNA